MDVDRVLTTGGVHLAYAVVGNANAAPMVLLHALGDRGADWAAVVPRLAEHFRVFTLDLRGHGESDWPGIYSFQLMCDDVIDVLDQLGLETVVLIGHSMGGVVAYLLAMQHPDRVGRLVVEDVSPPFKRDRPLPERPAGPLAFDWRVAPAIVAAVNAGDPDAWHGLDAITAPTLVVAGGAASHIAQDKLEAAAARIRLCTMVTISAGHDVHAARPTEFTDVVLGWLRN
ncbi:MAG: alpha/beta fold hydrolase [Streptosporangiales bacterium]